MSKPYIELAVLDYRNPEICSSCGGRCCQRFPGSCWPEEFGAPNVDVMESRVREALESRRYVVDFDFLGGYFIRPAQRGAKRVIDDIHDRVWSGYDRTCTFFTEGTGCQLEHEARPIGCRLLIPGDGVSCDYSPDDVGDDSKTTPAREWMPYTKLILAIANTIEPIEGFTPRQTVEDGISAFSQYIESKLPF